MNHQQLKVFLIVVVIVIIIIALIAMTSATFGPHGVLDHVKTTRVVSRRKAMANDDKRQLIPKIIVQTNASMEIPLKMSETIVTIWAMNPEYSYFYFDNESSRRFIEKEYGHRVLAAYDDLIPGAFKADMFRYCFLYKHGGVYVDTGMTCMKPFRELIRPDDEFVAPEDNENGVSIYNAFICCTPRHPIIARALLVSFKNIENRDKTDEMLNVTGPGVLGAALRHVLRDESRFFPDTDYGSGIRLIRHLGGNKLHRDPNNIVGEVSHNGVLFLKTKYPEYYYDRQWYHKTEHYGVLWNQDKVFKSVVDGQWKKNQISGCDAEKIPPKENQILRELSCTRKRAHDCRRQRIPKIIVQTNEFSRVPLGMFRAMKTIMDDNDEYDYFYYDAQSRRRFIERHFNKKVLIAYDRLVPGAFKADFFRYCFLYEHGGVYIDSGMVSLKPLRDLIDPDDELVIPEDDGRERMCNGFICAVPKHLLFKLAIERIVMHVEIGYYGNSALDITGPNMMGDLFWTVFGKKVKEGTPCYPGVKIIRYTSSLNLTGNDCPSTGKIFYKGVPILDTKYDGYYSDRKWYLHGEQYDTYWQLRQLYHLPKLI